MQYNLSRTQDLKHKSMDKLGEFASGMKTTLTVFSVLGDCPCPGALFRFFKRLFKNPGNQNFPEYCKTGQSYQVSSSGCGIIAIPTVFSK